MDRFYEFVLGSYFLEDRYRERGVRFELPPLTIMSFRLSDKVTQMLPGLARTAFP